MVARLSEMNIPRFPLLSDEEMEELLKKAKAGDQKAREKLINCNLKLVFNLVQRFENRGYELEDLFQVGTIGLMKAVDKFDPSFNVKFSTYAVPMIMGEIRRFLRDDSPVKVSRSLKETAFKVNRTKENLSKELGREPTIGEISSALDIPVEEIVEAMEAVQLPSSIHDTVYEDDGDPIYVLDQLAAREGKAGAWVDRVALKEVLKKLPEKHRRVIMLRFFEDKTQMEVAEIIGLSQVQVSRIERQALKIIRQLMTEPEPSGEY
ncbi:RNA polymerase sporulation sigma factor SigF [Calderihabitans maritimus]|uniref:RNA polymerase sigma factor n=1 Tax=Calderihabitans maritimus TaxID=1246530 RepID=A0A1Z5HPV8_9FIRM|nr:RNA polymerase sporulation sigma factor SigF [Calderihabitans maritimus]GAW91351.1 sigma 28, flagella/sporulation [Calderihabitans maritimus]